MSKAFPLLFLTMTTLLFLPEPAASHEPIFGLGPHTIFKGGVGIEFEFEAERASGGGESEEVQKMNQEIIYGLTEDWALTIATPFALKHEGEKGIEDLSLRTKVRFWRKDGPGFQNAAAVVAGLKFPTGSQNKGLGTGSTDYLLGINGGHEGLDYYLFGDVHFLSRTEGRGDAFFANMAFGGRPFGMGDYYDFDPVFYLELNYEETGIGIKNAGRRVLSLSPTFFLTYRNWALRGGWQLPVSQGVDGNSKELDERFALAVEAHF